MRSGPSAAILAASVLVAGTAWSACLPGQANNCVDLGVVPQISQQIVAGEPNPALAKPAPGTDPAPTYSGPTVGPTTGAGSAIRRGPTVGYRWSLD